jgi:hypothetical protein
MNLVPALYGLGAIVFVSGISHAQNLTGNDIISGCRFQAIEKRGTAQQLADGAQCQGLIFGVLDYSDAVASRFNTLFYCLPGAKDGGGRSKITLDQVIRIFVQYMDKNPQRLHESATSLLLHALAEAFPCK